MWKKCIILRVNYLLIITATLMISDTVGGASFEDPVADGESTIEVLVYDSFQGSRYREEIRIPGYDGQSIILLVGRDARDLVSHSRSCHRGAVATERDSQSEDSNQRIMLLEGTASISGVCGGEPYGC